MSELPPFAHAFAMERAMCVWLAVECGRLTIPVPEWSQRSEYDRGAPMIYKVEGKKSTAEIRPDILHWKSLFDMRGLEVKTQGYAPLFEKWRVCTTGFEQRQLDSYIRFQKVTGIPVSVAFAHLVEDEVRGGTLAEMAAARTPRVNARAGMVMFEYEKLPRWSISLSELLAFAVDRGSALRREGYSRKDHEAVLAYRENVARPNYERHLRRWGGVVAAPALPRIALELPQPKPRAQLGLFDGKRIA